MDFIGRDPVTQTMAHDQNAIVLHQWMDFL
jgi:hypothetical protein